MLTLCVFLTLLHSTAALAEACSDNQKNFTEQTTCPTSEEGLHKVAGVSDPKTCVVLCALRKDCVIVTFIGGSCVMGSIADKEVKWRSTASKCPTYTRETGKFLLLLDFRKSRNNAAQDYVGHFNAGTGGTDTAQGVVLDGGTYIQINTEGMWTALITKTAEFTIYLSVIEDVVSDKAGYYVTFPCTSGSAGAGMFRKTATRMEAYHTLNPSPGDYINSAFNLPTVTTGTKRVSIAHVVNKGVQSLYFNGSLMEKTSSSTTAGDVNQVKCIRLARYYGDFFKGTYVCYMVILKALGKEDLAALDTYCT